MNQINNEINYETLYENIYENEDAYEFFNTSDYENDNTDNEEVQNEEDLEKIEEYKNRIKYETVNGINKIKNVYLNDIFFESISFLNMFIVKTDEDSIFLNFLNQGYKINDESIDMIINYNRFSLFQKIIHLIDFNKLLNIDFIKNVHIITLCAFYDERQHFIEEIFKTGYKINYQHFYITKNKNDLFEFLYKNSNAIPYFEVFKKYNFKLDNLYSFDYEERITSQRFKYSLTT